MNQVKHSIGPGNNVPLVSLKAPLDLMIGGVWVVLVILFKFLIGSWVAFLVFALIGLVVGFMAIAFRGQGCDLYATYFVKYRFFGLHRVEVDFRNLRGVVLLEEENAFSLTFHYKNEFKKKVLLPLRYDQFRILVMGMKELNLVISDPDRLVFDRPSRSVEEGLRTARSKGRMAQR